MAHYAFLDENNIVTEVIVGRDEWEVVDGITNWEQAYSEVRNQPCKRTSYNTVGGVNTAGGTAFRKNYAGVGYFYDQSRDAFIAPKPYVSWILDEETCTWNAPIERPTDGKLYTWNEATVSWDEVKR
jgi:hypothetical protein